MKKLIIFMIMILMSLTGAFAFDTSNNEAYWTLDNILTDESGNSHTLTNYGATYTASGKINGAYNFDKVNDYMERNLGEVFNSANSYTFNMWIKKDVADCGSSGTHKLWQWSDNSGANKGFWVGINCGATDEIRVYTNVGTGADIMMSGNNADTNWHMVTVTINSGAIKTYFDGSADNTGSMGSGSTSGTSSTKFWIGAGYYGSLGNYFDGNIDEVSIWKRELSSTEISNLYNSGNGLNPYAQNTPTIQHDVADFYNSTSISIALNTSTNTNMSYVLDSGSETSICNVCNSTTLNLSSLTEIEHEIIFISTDGNGQVNSTTNFTIDLTNPVINIFNTSEINSYSVDWTNVFNYSDLNLDTCEITVESSTQDCSSYIFTNNGNQTIVVTVNDSAGNVATDSFVILINPYQYFYFEDPSTNPISNFSFGGNNYQDYAQIKTYDLGLGSQTLLFSKYGYAQTNVSFTLTTTSQINTTETIQVALLYVNIRDRNTENLITQTVDFDLVGTSYSSSYSTATGQKTVSDIKELPGTYRLSFTSSGYANNEYYFQHVGYSAVNITTYLINESLTIPIKLIVRDIFSNPIDACIVKVKQYFITDNDYLSVDMGSTNTLGEIIFDLEYDKYYQFVIECDGVIQTEPGQKITSTPLYITFDANEQLSIFEDLPNIATDITFSNLTNTTGYFRFEYDDSNNIVSQGCLKVYEEKFNGDILIDESCQSSASATINVNLNYTTNKKYVAKGFVTYNNKEYFVDSETKHFINGSTAWDNGLGLWASVLIIGVLFLIGTAMHPFASIAFAWLGAFVMIQFGALAISEGALLGVGALLIGILIFRGDKL